MAKALSRISPKEKEKIATLFSEIDAQLVGKHPIKTFIETILTEGEQLIIGRRLLIAQRLLAGRTQHEIINELRVSPNTVSHTRKWLMGKAPEYSQILKESERLAKARSQAREKKQKQPRELLEPYTFAGMKKKYPLHFLLFTLADELRKSGDKKPE